MASARYLAQQEEARQAQLDRIEAMLVQLTGGGDTAAAPLNDTGAVEPYEVDAEDLQESPTLVPVTPVDADDVEEKSGKSGKGKK